MAAALQTSPTIVTYPASADLSASQWCAVSLDTAGRVALPGAGAKIVGILCNDPAAIDRAASVQIAGIARVKLGGTVAPADNVKFDTSGRAVVTSAGELSQGQVKMGGAINQFGEIALQLQSVV